jgi:hypothetical protein
VGVVDVISGYFVAIIYVMVWELREIFNVPIRSIDVQKNETGTI